MDQTDQVLQNQTLNPAIEFQIYVTTQKENEQIDIQPLEITYNIKNLKHGATKSKANLHCIIFYKETDILIDKKVCTRKDKKSYNQDRIGSLKKWLPTTRTKKTIKQVLNRAEAQEIKPFSLTLSQNYQYLNKMACIQV